MVVDDKDGRDLGRKLQLRPLVCPVLAPKKVVFFNQQAALQ
jgi:hypothetical protein